MFNIRQGFHDTDYGQVYRWTAGPKEGPALVLIHQSGNSSDEYRGLVPYLAQTYRLIAMDLPGHGRSDDPTAEPSVPDYANAVRKVMDDLGVGTAHLLGHHGGGYCVISLLASDPDRFDKAILSGVGGIATAEEKQALKDLVLSTDTAVKPYPEFMGDAWGRYLKMASDDADVMNTLKPFIAFLSARLRPYRGVLINLKFDRAPLLEKLRGPVLLVHGTQDFYVEKQERLLDLIAKSERHVIDGFGAFSFYDKPEEWAGIIREYLEG